MVATLLKVTNQIIQLTEQFTRHFSMNFSKLILMMLKEYNGKKKSEIVLFHFLLLSDLEGMMLGGSKSKLVKHGENLEKVMSGLFFSEGVGSTLLVEIRSFVKFTRLIKVSCCKPILFTVLSNSEIQLSMFDKFLLIKSKLSC